MVQHRHRSPNQGRRDRAIKAWTLWLSLGAAIVRFVQVATSFFRGDK